MEKPKKLRGKDHGKPVKSQPSCTIFSIDPTTNQPYMTVEFATKLIEAHIKLFATNLLPRITNEDLVQDLLAKMCRSTFDPTKSSAKTFLYTCLRSRCASLYNHYFVINKRHLERPDFLMHANEGGVMYATDVLGTELSITPEDFLQAKESVESFYKNPSKNHHGNAPEGWRGLRELRTPKLKD